MGQAPSMEDTLFQLKFTARTLEKQSSKAEQAAKNYKLKCKQAMEKQNMDGARIFAENAIREKNQAANLLRLSSRIEAVAARVNTAVHMKGLTKNMSNIVQSMGQAMQSMDAAKISVVMDQFEKQFEDLDISSQFMEQSIAQSTAVSTPENQVDDLMKEVADQHGLEFDSKLDNLGNLKIRQEVVAENKADVKQREAVSITAGAGQQQQAGPQLGAGPESKRGGLGPDGTGQGQGGAGGGGGGMSLSASRPAPSAAPAPAPAPVPSADDDLEERLRRLQE